VSRHEKEPEEHEEKTVPSFEVDKLWAISLMDLIVPFLEEDHVSKMAKGYTLLLLLVWSYILKFPPTKNLRPISAAVSVLLGYFLAR